MKKKDKGEKKREDRAPRWVNEELPHTLDALKLYRNYCEQELKHCRRVLRRLEILHEECQRQIDARQKEINDARTAGLSGL